MKKITLLLFLLTFSLGYSQQVLIQDFETASSFTFAGFEGLGSASIVADPAAGGTRLNGLQLVSVSTGNPWQGAEVFLLNDKRIKLTTDKTVKIDVYATKAFTLLAKVEKGGTAPNSACSQAYTTPNAWQTLTFTFTQALDGTAVADGEYSKIVFFPNWNNGFGTPATNFTVNIDNIVAELGTTVIPPDPIPATAAPTPSPRNPADVISLFSNAYTDIAVDEWGTSWDSADIFPLQISGNDTYKIKFPTFLGIDFQSTPLDLSTMERFHMDIYTDADVTNTNLSLKLSQWNGSIGESSAVEISLETLAAPPVPGLISGSWLSIDVPLSAFKAASSPPSLIRDNIKQMIITYSKPGAAVYFDNLYFYKQSLGTQSFQKANINMYPNPVKNSLNIEAKSTIKKVSVYNVLGQEVLAKNPNNNTTTLQTNNLAKGVYVIKANVDGKEATSKFIKE